MFFDSWYALLRVLVVGVCAYVALVCLLRVSGKRTLSKLNAFDLVVTVALGSTMATVLLSKDVALAEGVLAFVLLIALQFVVAWLSVRSPAVGRLVKSEPRLLFFRGRFLRDAMRRERVTEGEVIAAIREQGVPSPEGVEAVVLETAGTFSVLNKSDAAPSSLRQVLGVPGDDRRSD
jgi:uncharacterized membrane protein YcaP (DUF421 family)